MYKTSKMTEENINTKIERKIFEITDSLVETDDIGLFTGEAGKAILYGYLDQYFKTDLFSNSLEQTLINSFQKLTQNNQNTSFCTGISGVLWSIHLLKKKGIIEISEDFSEFSDELKTSINNYASQNNFDFLHGSDGILFYLISTGNVTDNLADNWLSFLNTTSIKKDGRIWWDNERKGRKIIDLSLAHGMSNKIVLLAYIAKLYPHKKIAQELLNGAVNFLLNSKKKDSVHALYPGFIDENGNTDESRLGWCYGDISHAISLWRAGNLLNNPSWKNEAVNIMLHSTKRKQLGLNGIHDATFCHGSSGLAHIYNRFYKETSIKEFDEARWYWLGETLKMDKWVDGSAGYKTWGGNERGYYTEYSLLEGSIGIAMMLLGFLGDDTGCMDWDNSLLLS